MNSLNWPIEHRKYLIECVRLAQLATCQRSKCGSVVVAPNKTIIGRGFNSPPANLESQRRCRKSKDELDLKITDKTCCIHAEQRAILDAVRTTPSKIIGGRIYFIRLGDDGNPAPAGQPYCTICSKLALDVGITEFCLWHDSGVKIYPTQDYNLLSYKYSGV